MDDRISVNHKVQGIYQRRFSFECRRSSCLLQFEQHEAQFIHAEVPKGGISIKAILFTIVWVMA
jgi:hypothetical protein